MIVSSCFDTRNIPYYPIGKADESRFRRLCKDRGLKPISANSIDKVRVVYVSATWPIVEEIFSVMAEEM
jgi:hypothetical protein